MPEHKLAGGDGMEVKHGLGYQNYEKMMQNHIFYIDKTDFIRQWWDYADEVTLIRSEEHTSELQSQR